VSVLILLTTGTITHPTAGSVDRVEFLIYFFATSALETYHLATSSSALSAGITHRNFSALYKGSTTFHIDLITLVKAELLCLKLAG
jgi:hypothetical protein